MGHDTDEREEVRRQAERMAPATKADFTDTASHVSRAVDGTRIYEVAAGDDLQGIARRFYGDADGWRRILDENRDLIAEPGRLTVGQMLKIPARR
ncbi:MAG: LysM peptidoglycan-binding domain-containing protein [Rhodanobacter sp.]|jgi:nucleoid-associated protein YgaU